MFDELFSRLRHAPAAQGLLRRVESGGALTYGGVTGSGHAFLAAWLHKELPNRPIVLVAENLKAQETLHQDLETWLGGGKQRLEDNGQRIANSLSPAGSAKATPAPLSSSLYPLSSPPASLLFFPAWETLPHEDKLPHADVISERLETLVELMRSAECGVQNEDRSRAALDSALITTSITALLQRTFPPTMFAARTRTLRRGERVDPLDLIEWLEDNGYDSEAQVSAKGDIALRGGIVDVFPLTSPWPVRLEFFGDELESLRSFDPVTQISREGGELTEVVLPPAGELGVLKREVEKGVISNQSLRQQTSGHIVSDETEPDAANSQLPTPLATLLDYLPDDSIVILCEPEAVERHAEEYGELVPANDPFFASWQELRGELLRRRLTVLALMEEEVGDPEEERMGDSVQKIEKSRSPAGSPSTPPALPAPILHSLSSPLNSLALASLEAFRPISDRMPEQEVALAQRREFFHQLQRWMRAGFAVQVVCNNDGEAQRFGEVWKEIEQGAPAMEQSQGGQDARPTLRLGTLARGFLCEAAKFVVVTDAEIFGRYKVQRPRRMKSAHAIAARSAMDIDFSELEEGDYVVHLQHGIGRFKGLKVLPVAGRKDRTLLESNDPVASESGQECLVLEYAPSDTDREPPKLYVPVTEAHLISKYVGAGKLRPPLNTLGGKRWEKTKQQAERAVRDVAADLLKIQAQRATQPGHAFGPDTPWQREFESSFLFEETADQLRAIGEAKHDLEIPKPMDRLVCGDVGFGKTEVAIRAAFKCVMGGKQVAILVPTT
ncbi:MAG: Transcription-repair-coupling factor, partial [Verrucomicrobiota bacterium]